jgi:hypothetical protein
MPGDGNDGGAADGSGPHADAALVVCTGSALRSGAHAIAMLPMKQAIRAF